MKEPSELEHTGGEIIPGEVTIPDSGQDVEEPDIVEAMKNFIRMPTGVHRDAKFRVVGTGEFEVTADSKDELDETERFAQSFLAGNIKKCKVINRTYMINPRGTITPPDYFSMFVVWRISIADAADMTKLEVENLAKHDISEFIQTLKDNGVKLVNLADEKNRKRLW